MRNTAVLHGRWSALALCLSLCGCTAISDCKYECDQKIRTCQAWHDFDGCNDECFTGDYRKGWKAGYYDVLTGGSGCPPLFAPKQYWRPPVFCEHDPCRHNDWYCGYQDGVACAKCEADHHYLQVWNPCVPECCQTQTMSQSMMPSDPSPEGTSDHVLVEPGIVLPGDPSPADPVNGQPPSAQGQVDPAPSSGTQPPLIPDDLNYEKDPVPSNTQRKFPADWISRDRLVGQSESTDSNPRKDEGLLVQRLLANAAHGAAESASVITDRLATGEVE